MKIMSSFMANLVKFKSYAYESSVPVRRVPGRKNFSKTSSADKDNKVLKKLANLFSIPQPLVDLYTQRVKETSF
ncbi:hypothetical protein NQ315_006530 [Exocentrus adspersus]|uniref:Uncharacterized protein n=1 Tax=Exocentrus adspersus TaxID=1586481 RepID=A0AAV8W1T3_9CUCU|nr:hypothetical protein NQ315_006530 [Exocentrus adspersus]